MNTVHGQFIQFIGSPSCFSKARGIESANTGSFFFVMLGLKRIERMKQQALFFFLVFGIKIANTLLNGGLKQGEYKVKWG
jgi:hypothetical protein